MKKTASIILLCFLAAAGTTGCKCSNNDIPSVAAKDKAVQNSLSIVAPNGEKIADDMESLENEIKFKIAEQYGEDIPFEITSIEYLDVPEGYCATVNYRMENGISTNFVITHFSEDVKVQVDSNSVIFEF